jgi:hypothetical protein
VTIVAGTEGAGKSFIAAELAARMARGAGAASTSGGAAVYAHGADLAPGWLRARLDAAGAQPDRVALLELAWPTRTDEPTLGELLGRLAAAASVATASPDCRLLIVDHLELWAGELDRAASLARMNYVLGKLAQLAARLELAVVVLVRLQSRGGQAAARELGRVSSIAPVVWLVAEDEDRADRRLLVNVKNNLGPKRPGAAFQIADNRIVWAPGEVEVAAPEILSPAAAWVSFRQERTAAIQWLLSALGDGPLESTELFAQAASCGISARTLRRAAKSLGLAPHKQGFKGRWIWRLPDEAETKQAAERGADEAVGNNGRPRLRGGCVSMSTSRRKRAWEHEDGPSSGDIFDEDGHIAAILAMAGG